MERVSVIRGKFPVILVAPHGADDLNTEIITEAAAEKLDCCAVINRGFKKCDTVDVNNDLANCNRIDHAKQEVVYDEFLKPINTLALKLTKMQLPSLKMSTVNIFYIHGCKDYKFENQDKVGVIVGYGLGTKKDSLSCDLWRKSLFIRNYRTSFRIYQDNYEVVSGKRGGFYAGRDSNNINQYFRKHDCVPWIQSMQLNFPYDRRKDKETAQKTGYQLADVIDSYITATNKSDGSDISTTEYFI